MPAPTTATARYVKNGCVAYLTEQEAAEYNAGFIAERGKRAVLYVREDRGAECEVCKGSRNVPTGRKCNLGGLVVDYVDSCPACQGRGYHIAEA
jgi:hypothetical protein